MNKRSTALVIILLLGTIVIGGLLMGKNRSPSTPQSTTTTKSRSSVNNPVENTEIERYVPYSASAVKNTEGKKKILYFWAVWCPTCKVANAEFVQREDEIPKNVVLFKVNYDTETELKKKYNITYQHTFVYIDDNGKEITKWNGGGIKELLTYIK